MLNLEDVLSLERMIREQVAAEGGGPLETVIYYKVGQLPTGTPIINYKVYHAAHDSPAVAFGAIVVFIAANWKAILVVMGLVAAAALITTFAIKGSQIIWRAGQDIDDFLEEMGPAVVLAGAGIILLLLLTQLGKGKKKAEE